MEELPAADADLLGDLGGGELAAAGQTEGQQTLLVGDVLAGGQSLHHLGRQIRTLEVKSFRHLAFYTPCHNSAITY